MKSQAAARSAHRTGPRDSRRGVSARALAALTALALAVSGCAGLPRGGPLPDDLSTAEGEALEGLVAPLDQATLRLVPPPARSAFPAAFVEAAAIDPELVRPGDILDIRIWESGETTLFRASGGMARLDQVAVDKRGRLFLPFVGEIAAAGVTEATLRRRIGEALSRLALSPQVDVRVAAPRGREITVQGAIGRSGVYPIDFTSRRLTPMLAAAGGVPAPPEQVEVVVQRDGARGKALLSEIYADPAQDIALRPGDRVIVETLRERFVILGATGVQAELTFATRPFNLLSAIGLARGLRDFDADPTGVFLFRREQRAVADALLPGPAPDGMATASERAIVYRLDLTQPAALFVAQSFAMRDGDAVFVTNAPLTELRKFVQIFTSVLTPVQQTTVLSNGL